MLLERPFEDHYLPKFAASKSYLEAASSKCFHASNKRGDEEVFLISWVKDRWSVMNLVMDSQVPQDRGTVWRDWSQERTLVWQDQIWKRLTVVLSVGFRCLGMPMVASCSTVSHGVSLTAVLSQNRCGSWTSQPFC